LIHANAAASGFVLWTASGVAVTEGVVAPSGTKCYPYQGSGGTGCDSGGGAAWSENVVSFSATPTFSATATSNIITLTGNLTSWTLAAGTAGQHMTLTFCQNSTGNFTTGTTPSNVRGFFTIGLTASKCSSQEFTYSGNQTAWLAASTGETNE